MRLRPRPVGEQASTRLRRAPKVTVRSQARSIGSPSAPALAGYLSISSHRRYRIDLRARLPGAIAPTKANVPPEKVFSWIVFELDRPFDSATTLREGLSRIMGARRSLENDLASASLGSRISVGPGCWLME